MNYIPILCASALLALFVATKLLGGKSLNRIKARTVGHGQHGSARWATCREIKSYYTMVPYEPQKWRTQPGLRPTKPGIVLGSFQHGRHGKKITAWVDAGDFHAMMIASPGRGKTAYLLYLNIEYAMDCGISFVTLDTKGDLYRNMATIGEEYYVYHTVVYDFRKPMESDTYNLMSLVNKYMDRYRSTGSVDDKARAEQSLSEQMMEVPLMAPNELREMPRGEYVLLKTFCRSARTRMPLFTEWGITLEEKYHVTERAIREIEYMDVNELIGRLKKRQGKPENTAENKAGNGEDERRVHARNERKISSERKTCKMS